MNVKTNVNWTKVVNNNGAYLSNSKVLKIRDLDLPDLGKYICKATNQYGYSEIAFDLTANLRENFEIKINYLNSTKYTGEQEISKPNLQIKFSDKALISQGKRIDFNCETGLNRKKF